MRYISIFALAGILAASVAFAQNKAEISVKTMPPSVVKTLAGQIFSGVTGAVCLERIQRELGRAYKMQSLTYKGKPEVVRYLIGSRRSSQQWEEQGNITLFQRRGSHHYMEKVKKDLFRLKTVSGTGMSFKVTPTIKADDTIELDIDFELSSFTERIKIPEAPDLDIGMPMKNIHQTQTSVVVKDGETAVIGGFVKSGRTETAAKDAIPETISLLFVTAKAID